MNDLVRAAFGSDQHANGYLSAVPINDFKLHVKRLVKTRGRYLEDCATPETQCEIDGRRVLKYKAPLGEKCSDCSCEAKFMIFELECNTNPSPWYWCGSCNLGG